MGRVPGMRLLRRWARDESAVTGPLVALCIVFLLGTAATAIDLGYCYASQLRLQAATDAAALAGAQDIAAGSAGTAAATATSYSAVPGGQNASKNFVAAMAAGYPKLVCLTSTGIPCVGNPAVNAIVVTETARAPSFFARVFGVSNFDLAATATAGANGGAQGPLDVMVVLDTVGGNSALTLSGQDPVTLSDPAGAADLPNAPCRMNETPGTALTLAQILALILGPNICVPSSSTKLGLALGGLRTFLSDMQPCAPSLTACGAVSGGNVANPYAKIGLTVFPGLTNAGQAQYDYESGNCAGAQTPAITAYYASPVYQVVPLSSDYRVSDGAGLNPASNLALAAGGAGGCGVWAVNPNPPFNLLYGSFFADAITSAQNALAADNRPGARKVMILLSDGNSNALSQVVSATVTAGGSGYTAGANVTVTGGMGTGATAIATVVAGVVTAVNITNPGSGYTAVGPPTIQITPKNAILGLGGSGSGATAVVTLNPGVDQCHQAIAAAQAATAAGTTVYSIADGAEGTLPFSLLTCLTDILPQPGYLIPLISSCQTMQAIASDSSRFFAVNNNGTNCASGVNAQSDLNAVFAGIAAQLSSARLLKNGVT